MVTIKSPKNNFQEWCDDLERRADLSSIKWTPVERLKINNFDEFYVTKRGNPATKE